MKRFALGLFFACVFCVVCVLTINGCTPEQPVNILPIGTPVDILPADEFSPKVDNPNCPPGCCPTELTGRYHLRGRTKRFFGRVS